MLAVSGVDYDRGQIDIPFVPEQVCPLNRLQGPPTRQQAKEAAGDPRCHDAQQGALGGLIIGGPDVLAALTGVRTAATTAALRAGGVVASTLFVSNDGRVRASYGPAPTPNQTAPQVLKRIDLPAAGIQASPYVERGYRSTAGPGLLALVAASALLVIGASSIATGLAAAEGRADLATLAAVGASSSLRRGLAGLQSAVTAGLGALLGAVTGLVPAVGLIRAVNSSAGQPGGFVRLDPYPTVIPGDISRWSFWSRRCSPLPPPRC